MWQCHCRRRASIRDRRHSVTVGAVWRSCVLENARYLILPIRKPLIQLGGSHLHKLRVVQENLIGFRKEFLRLPFVPCTLSVCCKGLDCMLFNELYKCYEPVGSAGTGKFFALLQHE